MTIRERSIYRAYGFTQVPAIVSLVKPILCHFVMKIALSRGLVKKL